MCRDVLFTGERAKEALVTTVHEHVSDADEQPASILSKAFTVLGAFDQERRVLTLTEIARASGLPKSTTHRILRRLVPLGVIEPHGPGFKVGLPMRRFASVMPIESLRQSALPHLGSLHRWSGRHVHLGSLRRDTVVFVERFLVPDHELPSASPGTDLPAHATALGKAMLAFLTPEELEEVLAGPLVSLAPNTVTDPKDIAAELCEVRKRRVAIARGEAHPDVACVAAPILIRGRAVSAISVSTTMKDAAIDRSLVDAVYVTADRISRDNQQVLAQGHDIWFPGFD
ncbi:IclR family transcriptional regulator [Amycolatopsis acidiphila]|uniref:IclR family transcriptional regulator n=1 Tax=Amycolatopsis acidiphila TaxID=715473 RepID=UPI0017488796|nr:IclR family transcriptional regulator [Amycolatopsis acidiphila]GHG58445.1 IclR family transcriptional regulator [Amycolatopsis acidiphila]